MRCSIFTPHKGIFEQEVSLVEAEDSTGVFQILENHCDFFAHLEPGVLRCMIQKGEWRQFAVQGGILLVRKGDVSVALRDAIAGDSLRDVERKVKQHFARQIEEESRTRSALARMRVTIMRNALEFEKVEEL